MLWFRPWCHNHYEILLLSECYFLLKSCHGSASSILMPLVVFDHVMVIVQCMHIYHSSNLENNLYFPTLVHDNLPSVWSSYQSSMDDLHLTVSLWLFEHIWVIHVDLVILCLISHYMLCEHMRSFLHGISWNYNEDLVETLSLSVFFTTHKRLWLKLWLIGIHLMTNLSGPRFILDHSWPEPHFFCALKKYICSPLFLCLWCLILCVCET